MLVKIKVMAITRQGHFTHLISSNRRIYFWHRWLAYTSNAQIVRVLTLVNNIDLGLDSTDKEYNSTKVFIDLKNSEVLEVKEDKLQFISMSLNISSINIQYQKAL